MAQDSVRERQWRNDDGINMINDPVPFDTVGEQAALVNTLEERVAGSEGGRKEDYLTLLRKSREHLPEHKPKQFSRPTWQPCSAKSCRNKTC